MFKQHIIDKVETKISQDDKIEKDVIKTLSDMISNVAKSESLYKVTKLDDKTLKMTVAKPSFFYKIKEKSHDGFKLVFSKM